MKHQTLFRPSLAISLVTLVLAPLFFLLGSWQLQRAGEKEQMLAELERANAAETVALEVAADLSQRANFEPVALSGQWLDKPVIYLQNRTSHGRAGVWVYRLLQDPEQSLAVLVNFGWQPARPGTEDELVPPPTPEQAVRGLLTSPPSPGLQLGEESYRAEADAWVLTRIDVEDIGAALNLRVKQRSLRLTDSSPVYERDWQPQFLPPSRHQGYAVQWFALCATAIVLFLLLGYRRARQLRQP